MLEGKAFSLKFACKTIDEAHNLIRNIDPKSRFMYSRLSDPVIDEISLKIPKKMKKIQTLLMKNLKLWYKIIK